MKPLRIGDLFCGPGGLALGASQVVLDDGSPAFIHQWANDIDRDACDTFIRNIPGASPSTVICRNVRDLNFEELSPIDCLAFGFPCNDFSVVGERLGMDGKYGPLYSYGVRALNYFRPSCFVAENVSGLASANEGRAFAQILSELRAAGPGYSVTSHLYKAEEYGVPQKRRRILIVGIDKRLGIFYTVPPCTTADRPPTVRDALVLHPIGNDVANNEVTKQSPEVIERLKYIKPGQNAFTANLPEHLRLRVKGAKISQIYRRLSLDEPAYTVTGSGGGGTHIYHWEEPRALTNRERARLQGFPDSFVFCGSKESVRRQIGMAVPPPLARVVLQHLIDLLTGKVKPQCEPSSKDNCGQYSLALETQNDYRVIS